MVGKIIIQALIISLLFACFVYFVAYKWFFHLGKKVTDRASKIKNDFKENENE